MDDSLVKIRFELDPTEWHGETNERFWAEPVSGAKSGTAFRLRNSPFYRRGVSFQDIVAAVPRTDGGGGLQFAGVIEHSGHSTYMLLVPPERKKEFEEDWWPKLQNLGCTFESTTVHLNVGHRDLYSVDVPAASDVHAVYVILEEGELLGVWEFQEGHMDMNGRGEPRRRSRRCAIYLVPISVVQPVQFVMPGRFVALSTCCVW